MKITVEVKTISPISLSSGRGDVIVDADVVHDEYGLPYIPAKRFRGVLYESALEVTEMLSCAGLSAVLNERDLINVFGRDEADGHLTVRNLYLPDYQKVRAAWAALEKKFKGLVNADDVLAEYSELRYQTRIDEESGTAAEASLRNSRVVDAGHTFCGELSLSKMPESEEERRNEKLLALALKNLRYLGAKRNRGFGEIECRLPKNMEQIAAEALAEVAKK